MNTQITLDQLKKLRLTGMADAYANAHGVMIDQSAAAMYRSRAAQLNAQD